MTPGRARIVLGLLIVLLALGLLPTSQPAPLRTPPPGRGDAALYAVVVGRLGTGETYYEALGGELRRDNYPTASVFNWRTPLHLSMVAYLGSERAATLLKLLALGAVLATAAALARFGTPAATVGTITQMGALATAFRPQAEGIAELWAGVLIALALCAYYARWWSTGALCGAAATFLRELAAPFAGSVGVIAILRGRRREALIWVAAGLLYVAYFAYHAVQVQAHRAVGDLAHAQSWLGFNGLRFLLATAGVNGWLQFLPAAATSAFVAAALAGTASPQMPGQVRVALLVYAAVFSAIGLPFNYYWGFVTAPLWAFGLAHAPDGIRRLLRLSLNARVNSIVDV